MAVLLFPGRHLLSTRFQERYLRCHLQTSVEDMPLLRARTCGGRIEEVVFAITSANQSNSRFNPMPLEIRAVGVDRLARDACSPLGIHSRMVPIPHYGPTPRFAEYLLKEIAAATEGELLLTPANTVVLSSTAGVVEQFLALGFGVLPGELTSLKPVTYVARTPIEALQRAVTVDRPLEDGQICGELSQATLGLWRDYPDVLWRTVRLYRDPILTSEGSLTEMRNYSVYAQGMNERAIMEVKYNDIREAIVPGRIVDEGCADGALLVPIARDFPDSDLMGIEITGEFLARCHERQRALEYGGTFIHFHQRNIMEPLFQPNSIDTTICNSTTHELWSYGKQETTLRTYLAEKFLQLRRGGRLIIRDVLGPEDGEDEVLLWCNAEDGRNDGTQRVCQSTEELAEHVGRLSTAARFERFAEDFLADQRRAGQRGPETKLRYVEVVQEGRPFFRLRLRDGMEYLLKKDYAANWSSEMNEEFAFWNFGAWKQSQRAAGFRVLEGSEPGLSREYASPWIIKNRLEGKVALYCAAGDVLTRLDWPATNMVLVGQK